MRKFGRTFELKLAPWASWGNNEATIVIKPPYMIDFEIKKDSTPSANTGIFTIYNLGENTLKRIFALQTEKQRKQKENNRWARIQLSAGYGGENAVVFDGEIKAVRNSHEQANLKTIIEAGEGLYAIARCFSVHEFKPGDNKFDLIKALVDDLKLLPGGKSPYIGKFRGKVAPASNQFSRNLVIFGNTWEQLKKYTEEHCFIDNGRAYAIPPNGWNEEEPLFEISARKGLIGTPEMKEHNNVSAQMLFEPSLVVGSRVDLKSHTLPGNYIIDAIVHKCDALGSGGNSSKWITTITLAEKGAPDEKNDSENNTQNNPTNDTQDALLKNATNVTNLDLIFLLEIFKKNLLSSINCHKLGTIVSFNRESQTASVAINHKHGHAGELFDYPKLHKVPVFIPAGAKAALTMPVEAGDTCLLLFSDCDISTWFGTSDDNVVPPSQRTHNYNDALAIVGFRSNKSKLTDYGAEDAELRNDGAVVAVGKDKVSIRNNNGKNLHTILNDLIKCLKDFKILDSNGKLCAIDQSTQKDFDGIKKQFDDLLK